MTPLTIDYYYNDCPCCGAGIRISNSTIARHERGLGYIPYRLYHKFARSRKVEDSIREQMKRNLCIASGKSVEEARRIHIFQLSESEEGKQKK